MTYEKRAFEHLEYIEWRYHIFKAVLIAVGVIIIVIVNIITYQHLLANSNRNRALLACSLSSINAQSRDQAHDIINKCLEADK